MRTVRIGLAAQLLLLGGLALTVGLSPAGWLAGTGYGLVLGGLLARSLAGDPAGPVPLHPAASMAAVRAPATAVRRMPGP